jgi:conjugal transfer pilin signal peptidase TrbI
MNITANNNFAIKAVVTITATFTVMYIIMNYFMLGMDLQIIKSSEYDYFFINKFEINNDVGDYIAYKAKPLPPYFEEGSIFIKKLAALPGDVITVKDGYQRINNGQPRYLHLLKTLKKETNDFDRTVTVSDNALWVMGTTKASYDSRYTGEISDSQVVGRAYPLW